MSREIDLDKVYRRRFNEYECEQKNKKPEYQPKLDRNIGLGTPRG